MIKFERDICSNLDHAIEREWLETNGLGGFAASTIVGLNTRRYHGLLMAATNPPVGRTLLLSKIEETIDLDGKEFELGTNQYPGAIHPRGFQFLKSFRLDPFPVFTYQVGQIEIEKSFFMVHGENTSVLCYRFSGSTDEPNGEGGSAPGLPASTTLTLRPLVAFRDYHSLTHENSTVESQVGVRDGIAVIRPYRDMPALFLSFAQGEVLQQNTWYRNFEYAIERERGLDFHEDLLNPCALRFSISVPSEISLIASTEPRDVCIASEYRAAEIKRRESVRSACPSDEPLAQQLAVSADQFIVRRGQQNSVIAGYHWFGDWGRDTMIALPGLTLATGRFDIAKSILLEFARFVSEGMLPNRFPEVGEEPEYNTVDATLWYFNAIHAYLRYTGDLKFVGENFYDLLSSIIGWHELGTRYGIVMDDDGLLLSGRPGVQLTWMDVKIGDWVVTPRSGKAVEIQALWYNALREMKSFAREFGRTDDEQKFAAMAGRAHLSFNEQFWSEQSGCLYDVIDGGAHDASIRPNQIIAGSLPYTMLSTDRLLSVVDVVERELLTPFGLRSLARTDAKYRGRYEGDGRSRDSVYHQGTVWGWLIGPFVTAYVRAHQGSRESRLKAASWLDSFREHMTTEGLNHISEIFDGDEPHKARGCVAQAWSVGEVLRALVEDVNESSGADKPAAAGQ